MTSKMKVLTSDGSQHGGPPARHSFVALLGCAMFALMAVQVPSARAATDTTPPILNLPSSFSFVKGSTISTEYADPDGERLPVTSFAMRVKWSAQDPSGICGYRTKMLDYIDGFDAPYGPWSMKTSLLITESDYTDQLGGGSFDDWAYQVQARDCFNNYTAKVAYSNASVVQDDGWNIDGADFPISYAGAWSVNDCACWSAGTTHRTTAAGASAQFTVKAYQREVGLVMETAPDRGKFQIWVNGALRATVDTYATVKRHRVVVWTGKVPADSTIKLVNLATPGRPRIDLDAILLDEAP